MRRCYRCGKKKEDDYILCKECASKLKVRCGMTREDAIEILQLIRLGKHITNDKALEMAIKALEQEPTEDMPCVTPEEMQECKDIVKKYTPKQEPCTDAVSREAVIDLIEQAVGNKNVTIGDFTFGKSLMLHHINELPPVQPKRQTGKWIDKEISNPDFPFQDRKIIECSKCHYGIVQARLGYTNYCPNCGAKMESED